MLRSDEAPALRGGWARAFLFGAGAAIVIQIARLMAASRREPRWLGATLVVRAAVPRRVLCARRSSHRELDAAGAPFALAALVVNVYPWDAGLATEVLVALYRRRALVRLSRTRTWVNRSVA
jgi:hypothetical protein